MDTFNQTVDEYLSFVKNDYISAILLTVLILYAPFMAPMLPQYVYKYFDYSVVKFIFFFLLAYLLNKNPAVAFVSAVVLLILSMAVSKLNMEHMKNVPINDTEVTTACLRFITDKQNFDILEAKLREMKDSLGRDPAPSEINYLCTRMALTKNAKKYGDMKEHMVGETESKNPEISDECIKFMKTKNNFDALRAKVQGMQQKLNRQMTPAEVNAMCTSMAREQMDGKTY